MSCFGRNPNRFYREILKNDRNLMTKIHLEISPYFFSGKKVALAKSLPNQDHDFSNNFLHHLGSALGGVIAESAILIPCDFVQEFRHNFGSFLKISRGN